MGTQNLGIKRLEAVVFYTNDLERSRRFYVDQWDFAELGCSDATLTQAAGQRSAVFKAGSCLVLVEEPLNDSCRAARFLRKQAPGIGSLVLEVEDAAYAFDLLEQRGATPISEVQTHRNQLGYLKTFSITTPFGGATMRFVERCGLTEVFPGFEARPWAGPTNRFGLTGFDTVTSSFETMKPALLWMQHVLGFESYGDVPTDILDSSSARTEVMWDRASGLKFANNEPCRPAFKTSQANEFAEQNRGDGIQRVALAVTDIVHTVKGLKAHGVEFMSTAHRDDEHLRERMEVAGLDAMDVDVSQLRDLGIRMDGDGTTQVTLQAFLKEASRHHRDPEAGPFFYEVIQTAAERGGDAAQVKAFLEAIERNQSLAKTA